MRDHRRTPETSVFPWSVHPPLGSSHRRLRAHDDRGYDSFGNVTSIAQSPSGITTTIAYVPATSPPYNLISSITVTGGALTRTSTFTYDGNKNLQSITSPSGTVNLTTNLDGTVGTMTIPLVSSQLVYSFSYTGGVLTGLTTAPPSGSFTSTVDGAGRVLNTTDAFSNIALPAVNRAPPGSRARTRTPAVPRAWAVPRSRRACTSAAFCWATRVSAIRQGVTGMKCVAVERRVSWRSSALERPPPNVPCATRQGRRSPVPLDPPAARCKGRSFPTPRARLPYFFITNEKGVHPFVLPFRFQQR